MMKKRLVLFWVTILTALTLMVGCGSQPAKEGQSSDDKKIVVGATPVPHVEILKEVQPLLAKEGITLEIREFTDYTIINKALAEREIDANFFQHQPYLDDSNQKNGYDLVAVAKVHIEPLGIYSKKIKDLKELKEGATVGIPNDATNGGRALNLLQQAGLIKLKDGVGVAATKLDLVENPRKLEIKELDAALLAKTLDDTDISVINGNYALDAGLVPAKDALVLESAENNPYANILVARKGEEAKEAFKKLTQALNSPEIKKFIEGKYNGSVIPAF